MRVVEIDEASKENRDRPRNGRKLRSPYGLPPFPPIPGSIAFPDLGLPFIK